MNLQFLKNPDPRYLPPADEVEKKVEELQWLDIVEREKILEQLKTAFANTADHSEVLAWRAFWYIYTNFTWKFLRRQDKNFVIDTAVGRQIPMAAVLGFDLQDELFRYLEMRSTTVEEMASLYSGMRKKFFDSSAVLGKMNGKDFLLSDLVKKEKYLNSVKDNTLEEADFRDDLQRALFPKEENFLTKYFSDDREAVVTGLLNITDFFLGVEPDKVWFLVDAYIYPDRYEAMAEASDKILSGATAPQDNLELPDIEPVKAPIVAEEPMEENKPSYVEIREQIEKNFSYDSDGNFDDLDGVLGELGDLAEKYNDPKIEELYYFDENSGTFKWNI